MRLTIVMSKIFMILRFILKLFTIVILYIYLYMHFFISRDEQKNRQKKYLSFKKNLHKSCVEKYADLRCILNAQYVLKTLL